MGSKTLLHLPTICLIIAVTIVQAIDEEDGSRKKLAEIVDEIKQRSSRRSDDNDSDSSDTSETSSTAPSPPSFPSKFPIPFLPSPFMTPHGHRMPNMFSQIPAPPVMMPAPPHMYHHPSAPVTAASTFTAYYRPLPAPVPHHPFLTSRMSIGHHPPPHPLSVPFMPHGHPSHRSMLPVMVPIRRWDDPSSLLESLVESESVLENEPFLDEPLTFDAEDEELLAASRKRFRSPPPPPQHPIHRPSNRHDPYEPYPDYHYDERHEEPHHRRHEVRGRDAYEPVPSENRYPQPPPYNRPEEESHSHDAERRDDREEHMKHDQNNNNNNMRSQAYRREEMVVDLSPSPTIAALIESHRQDEESESRGSHHPDPHRPPHHVPEAPPQHYHRHHDDQ